MRKFFNLANGTLLLFLLASMVANILQGELTYKFTKKYNEDHEGALHARALILTHDSLADLRGDALLKGQIDTHLMLLRLQLQMDSIIIHSKK